MKHFLLLLFACPLLLFGQRHYDRLAAIDVQHYDFQITLNDDGESISMVEWVTVKFLQPAESFTLDLVGEKNGKGMSVKLLNEIKKPSPVLAKYTHTDDQLVIFPESAARAGDVLTFTIAYRGIPRDGLVISKNRHGHKTYFGDNWPNRARHWLATVDHPSDKATVSWQVTVPKGFEVVANGVLKEQKIAAEADGRSFFHYATDVPLPTKVMVMAAADFEVEEVGSIENIPVSSWVFPEDSALGFDHYDDAAPILQAFIDSIAPYAYGKLANVQSKTRYGGMENASSIFYYEASVDEEIVPLLAHEIAHQWFGNMATEANWHHIWLSEGFATYFTNLYIEWSQGAEAFRGRMERERAKVIRYAKASRKPVVDTSVTNYNALLNPNSYEKGAWVLHMLRQKVGYTTFMQGVRSYYAQFRGKNALTEDLLAVMEEESGEKFGEFFQQWLYTGGHPELELEMVGQRELRVKQVQDGPAFQFELEIGFEGKKGGMHMEKVSVNAAEQTFQMSEIFPAKWKTMVPDPNVKLLAEFKVKD